MKPCPFCGKAVEVDDGDTLYPDGCGWKDNDFGRSYHSFREVPAEQWCWKMHCTTSSGGCGAEISGDSKQECIDNWNRRPASRLGQIVGILMRFLFEKRWYISTENGRSYYRNFWFFVFPILPVIIAIAIANY